MITSLTGTLEFLSPTDTYYIAVINVGGVGFEVRTTSTTAKILPGIGEACTILTYLHVREDALELAGFSDEEERELYRRLLSVSGVGQKAALSILCTLSPDKLSLAIASGDSKLISTTKGVGAKTAQIICAKLAGLNSSPVMAAIKQENSAMSEALSALDALGYSRSDAAAALAKSSGETPEELIKVALRNLAKG
jgi:Holliday junction DNA helicase, RuvA subunit